MGATRRNQLSNLTGLGTAASHDVGVAPDQIPVLDSDGKAPGVTIPTYEYTQSSAATTWTITHNLDRHPAVTVVDSSGRMVLGNVQYLSLNSLTVSFTAGFAGKAYLN